MPRPPEDSPSTNGPDTDRAVPTQVSSSKRARTIVAYALTGLALAAVGVVVVRQRDAFADALAAAAHAPVWLFALALLLPLINWWLVAISFWLMNARYAPTPLRENVALIASAWLLNYLPMRPGMIGRVAYHKKRHGIPVSSSIRILFELTAMSGVAMLLMLVIALAVGHWAPGVMQTSGAWAWWAVLFAPALLFTVLGAAVRGLASGEVWSRWAWTAAVRYADVAVWAARYAVVFALVGAPLGPREAVVVAIVSQIALLLPVTGNGLGVREAAVGAVAGAMPAVGLWFGADLGGGTGGSGAMEGAEEVVAAAEARAAVAVAADLVHRGLEVAVAVPVGLLGSAWLSRNIARTPGAVLESSADPESGLASEERPSEAS